MARILTISSFVARGHVGNSATTFPLMRLGHDVLAMPTLVLAHHPGHAPDPARVDMPDLLAMGGDILGSPTPHPVDAVMVGYVAGSGQAAAIARLVGRARALKLGIPVLLDPICGDDGALYVDERVAAEIAAVLLPMADIATPNVTELAALTEPGRVPAAPAWSEEEIVRRAAALGPRTVIVTSAPAAPGTVANLVVGPAGVRRVEAPRVEVRVNGTGDLLSGLILAGLLDGQDALAATAYAAAAVHDVLAATRAAGTDEMMLAGAQDAIVRPACRVRVTAIRG